VIEVARQENSIILKIIERHLQMYQIPQLKEAIDTAIKNKPRVLVFDMSEVDHIDSSALGAILYAQKTLNASEGKMALIHVSPKVMQILKVTKSENHLQIFDSLERALK